MNETRSSRADSIRTAMAFLHDVTPWCLVVLFALGCGRVV
jgi:hypothetical protein